MIPTAELTAMVTRRQLLVSAAAGASAAAWGARPATGALAVPSTAPLDLAALPSPLLLAGDERHAYRDPAAIYHAGEFHLFYTYNPLPDADGRVYWFTAVSKSRDLRNWTESRLLTPQDQTLNYSSPGNVIRFADHWVRCLQIQALARCSASTSRSRSPASL